MTSAALETVPATVVRTEIDRILATREFRGGGNALQKWLGEKVEELITALSRILGIEPRDVGDILVGLLYFVLAAAVGWIVWRIVRSRRDRVRAATAAEVLDPEAVRRARVRELRREARLARERGDRLLALRLYFTALVVGLGEKGDLSYRDAWTNRELLERGEPKEPVRARLAPLVPELDARSFGHVPVEDGDVTRLSNLVEELLGAERLR